MDILSNSTIVADEKFLGLLKNLEDMSFLSSRETIAHYSNNPNFIEYAKQIQVQRIQALQRVKSARALYPNMSDSDFYKNMMSSFLKPVIERIINEYGEILPPEKMIKVEGLLDPSNIAFTASKDQNDFQADSELGKLIINPIKTSGDSIEEKIVTSMGSIIHETFHLMINMLKDPKRAEQLGERLMYKVATTEGDKELHFAPGKYGQVLSEGFVEKLSTEFARRNGFYHTISPSYIPYVNFCDYISKQDPSIDSKFLFTHDADAVVAKMTPDARKAFESTERLVVFNNFETKEVKKENSLKGIKSDSVKESWMEREGQTTEVIPNPNFNKKMDVNGKKTEEPFEWNSQQEKNTFEAKKVQNQEHLLEHPIEQGKVKESANIKDKPKVLTMQPVKNSNNGNGNNSNSSGFVSIITLIAILFAAIGLVSFLAYQIIMR